MAIDLKQDFKAVAFIGVPLNGATPYAINDLGGTALNSGLTNDTGVDNIIKPGGMG
jgi:hypothetical protein